MGSQERKQEMPDQSNLIQITITVSEINKSYFFGAIKIFHLIEDRVPNVGYALQKYKHQLTLTLFGKKVFSTVLRSPAIGFVSVNDKEVIIKRD
jgi:hypothetical protein